MPESVTDGDTPEDLLIDATDHPDGCLLYTSDAADE